MLTVEKNELIDYLFSNLSKLGYNTSRIELSEYLGEHVQRVAITPLIAVRNAAYGILVNLDYLFWKDVQSADNEHFLRGLRLLTSLYSLPLSIDSHYAKSIHSFEKNHKGWLYEKALSDPDLLESTIAKTPSLLHRNLNLNYIVTRLIDIGLFDGDSSMRYDSIVFTSTDEVVRFKEAVIPMRIFNTLISNFIIAKTVANAQKLIELHKNDQSFSASCSLDVVECVRDKP